MEETVDAHRDVEATATPEAGSESSGEGSESAGEGSEPAEAESEESGEGSRSPEAEPEVSVSGAELDLGAQPLVYETFVALRGPALVRLARGLLRDPYLAEDVVQDVLARALLQWPRVSAAHDVDAYVRRMVVNACTSWFRRAARRERVTDQPFVLDRPVPDRTDDFVDRDLLLALLRRLPAKQRAVLVLRHYEGLRDVEIAEVLGSSEVTVRSNAHRGLAKLRELIAAAEAEVVPSGAEGPAGRLSLGRRPRRPSS